MLENRVRLNDGFHYDVFYMKEKERVVRISDKNKTNELKFL
ncbi:hypothetical protein [Bacillus sp. XF8]|nr:hypothetical protein [Bacillus sp. XF8]